MKLKKLRNIVATTVATLAIAVMFPTGVSASWKQDNHGWWNTNGSSYSVGWENINSTWYYFGQDGYMNTGWINNNGTWYYADNSGSMKTGWVQANGTWYFMNGSGAMQTGWVNNNGAWYYTDASGAMQTGLITINNNTYYLNEFGAMQTGNLTINGVNYTFAATGEKINSTTTNTNNNNSNTTNNSDKNTSTSESSGGSSGGSGGSGGGSSSGSTNSSKLSSSSSYSDLYGRWTVKNHIDSNIKSELDTGLIKLCIGESFTVKSDRITSIPLTIINPIINEDKLTSSEFKDEYGDSLKNIGITGDKVKCITVTDKDNNNRTVDVLVADNGSVYAILRGCVFKLIKS
ncbi:N-acetylmuramoyl-L-alanine amidase family protein [Clostridium botulinum]|nr:N-acetylmuramoyl-L-alanine amidase family protein [Clostridium botulinum]